MASERIPAESSITPRASTRKVESSLMAKYVRALIELRSANDNFNSIIVSVSGKMDACINVYL